MTVSVLLQKAKVGDTVLFGTYEQDNDISNGREDIEWRVLETSDNKILVISEYALDCQQYNREDKSVTWEKCTLRKWLNESFVNESFSAEEQKMIAKTMITADANPKYSTDPGKDTTDKVFLLSIMEADKYFGYDNKMCVPTKYAIKNGAYTSSSYKKDDAATCWWWLRSPGYDSINAAGVGNDGDIDNYGNNVNDTDDCVRPALWIEI